MPGIRLEILRGNAVADAGFCAALFDAEGELVASVTQYPALFIVAVVANCRDHAAPFGALTQSHPRQSGERVSW